jgi:hypothetical protein
MKIIIATLSIILAVVTARIIDKVAMIIFIFLTSRKKMKIIIATLSIILAVTTAITPQKRDQADKIFDTLSNVFQPENLHQILNVIGNDKSDRFCSLCQTLVSTLDSFLGDVNVQTKLSAAMAAVCDKIPDQNKQQKCTNMITKDFPMVLDMIKSIIDPNMMCVNLFKTCPAPSNNTGLPSYDNANPFIPKVVDDLKCAACFSGIGFIQFAFLNNDFAQFCAEEIQPVCDFLSDPERHQKCLDTVLKVVGDIFQVLNNYINPKTLCIGSHQIPNDGCPATFFEKMKF